MSFYPVFLPLVGAAYLLGSVPFGVLLAKAHGKDLRTVGSGNIGATNVARALGRKWAYVCFGLDVLKGMLPMVAALLIGGAVVDAERRVTAAFQLYWLGVGCAAILGHVFPVYLRFQGGKGVATSFGVALGIWPYFTLCAVGAFAVWLAVVFLWRYVSLASMVAAISFLAMLFGAIGLLEQWKLANLWPLVTAAVLIAAMVVYRHRSNIGRLLDGTEPKVLTKKKDS